MVVGRVPEPELVELRSRFEAMAALLVGERFVDFDRYLDANYAFHEGLVSLAHSAPLTTAFAQLHIKSVMTRSFGVTPVTSQSFVEAQRGITEGIERGDADAARGGVPVHGPGQAAGAPDPGADRRPALTRSGSGRRTAGGRAARGHVARTVSASAPAASRAHSSSRALRGSSQPAGSTPRASRSCSEPTNP